MKNTIKAAVVLLPVLAFAGVKIALGSGISGAKLIDIFLFVYLSIFLFVIFFVVSVGP